MDVRLDGRVALVTGAGEGIGRGCALALAASGAEVFVNDKNPTTGEDTANAIRLTGGKANFIAADVSNINEVTAMFHAVALRSSALHILINNAGINLFKGIQETSLEEWNSVFNVDSTGIFLVIKTALPLLKSARSSSIINIASVHATMTVPTMTAYAAAKGAVLAVGAAWPKSLAHLVFALTRSAPALWIRPSSSVG